MPGKLTFTAVGHVTNDRMPDGSHVPGGSALYAALAAKAVGAEARIVTSHGPDFVGLDLLAAAGVAVENVRPAARTTCFENVYQGGARRQKVHAVAEQLVESVPSRADVVFLCPVIDEVGPDCFVTFRDTLVAAGLQGWLRAVGPDGGVTFTYPDIHIYEYANMLFCSIDDLGGPGPAAEERIAALREVCGAVIVTEAERGARLHFPDEPPWRVLAYDRAKLVDPTGAGDVFAATMLACARSGAPPLEAAIHGACAASFVIEGVGPGAIAAADVLRSRVERYRREITLPFQQG